MTPPINSPLEFTMSKVFAVPKSTTITGSLYNRTAAIPFAILSAPISLLSLSFNLIPISIFGERIIDSIPNVNKIASYKILSNPFTTEAIMQLSMQSESIVSVNNSL